MKFFVLTISLLLLFSCTSKEENTTKETIRAADISFLPLIESEETIFYHNDQPQDVVTTLKNADCNYIRIRLWHSPVNQTSSLNEVKTLANRIRQKGMKVWISVHYSDTWADPGSQSKPVAWQNLNFNELKNAVSTYTTQVMTEINPDIIQIGNETNDGMLWPEGKLSLNENQYVQLVNQATQAVRLKSSTTKILLHYAGIEGADYYFNKMTTVDYDYIGLSYYPIWHGKNLNTLQNTINQLGTSYSKKVVIAETAYPFTLDYNDFTNNIVGQQDQLIPAYAATQNGQKEFLLALKNIIKQSSSAIGFCYWEPAWVAFRGPTSTNGSPWENQALWDFGTNSLSSLEFFQK